MTDLEEFRLRHNLTREQHKEMIVETKHLYGLNFLQAKRLVQVTYDITGKPPRGIEAPKNPQRCYYCGALKIEDNK